MSELDIYQRFCYVCKKEQWRSSNMERIICFDCKTLQHNEYARNKRIERKTKTL